MRDGLDKHGPITRWRLPRTSCVDRVEYVKDFARGRRIIHVGFGGFDYDEIERRRGSWLHGHLAEVATSLVGLDRDSRAIERAVAEGHECHLVDCSDARALRDLGLRRADGIVAGEILEHLDHTGAFLDALHELIAPTGRLILTTPNAACALNALAALMGREYVNADHVGLFSYYTLANLLGRHGWTPLTWATYMEPPGRVGYGPLGTRARAAVWVAAHRSVRLLARVAPFVGEGLIVEAVPVAPRPW